MSIFSIGSIWIATVSAMEFFLVDPPLEAGKAQRGFVVQALSRTQDGEAAFIGPPRVAQDAVGLVEAGGGEPQFRLARPDQDHALGDLERARAVADMQRADLQIVLEPEQHVDVADRLRQM